MSYTPFTWVDAVSKVGPTNLNHLETGVQATAVVADNAIPKPAGPSTNQVLSWSGTAWVAVTLASSGTSGVLASRPAAASASNAFYYATDQFVLYFSNGAAWSRMSDPAGSGGLWFNASPPSGYVAYDGSTLPGSTGIYADLFAHLGTTTTPDTRGRMPVGLGTHADVSTIGNNEGTATAANRRPKHRTTNALSHSLTLPNHTHPQQSEAGSATDGNWYNNRTQSTSGAFQTSTTTSNPSSLPAITGSITGSIGSNTGTDPLDASPYITFLIIAKL